MATVLLGVVLCVAAVQSVPTAHQIHSALERAREINFLKRTLEDLDERETGSSEVSRCPMMMAKFHGRQGSTELEQDRRSVDLLTASRLLLDEGFTLTDLQHETVRSEFARAIGDTCTQPVFAPCDITEKYRRIDGSCNNINNPRWGMAGVAQRRMLPPAYADGINLPRSMGVNGLPLPNPRLISNSVHRGVLEVRNPNITLHTFQMGQFVDHDLILTPVQSDVTDCCASETDSDHCMNIRIEGGNDQYQPLFKANYCMEFHRSAPVFCPDAFSGTAGRRQQRNDITSYVDASNVYGSSQAKLDELRQPGTGFMKTVSDPSGTRLPNAADNSRCNANTSADQFCSNAGDVRVNVVPSLTAYHNVFVLEHNRIARMLQTTITDADVLFQETRKIIIAVMQKIVYDEFLPSFLSPAAMSKYRLGSGELYKYDESIDATIANDFGIAYRMGHTWIPKDMTLFGRDFKLVLRLLTDAAYNDPALTYVSGNQTAFEGLAYWLTGVTSPGTDRVLEEAARSRLFINRTTSVAFDLAALNIQRGRDHGLPAYNEYRKICGLTALTSDWNSLVDHSTDTVQRLLEAGYSSPLDIDLFTGGLSENSGTDGSLGPTLECIIADQFMRQKYGDRFWYQGEAAGLTTAQQIAVQQYSMSKLLCVNYNFDRIHFPSAFNSSLPRVNCSVIPDLDWSAFLSTITTTTTTTQAAPVNPPIKKPRRLLPAPQVRDLDEVLEKLIRELSEIDDEE